MSNHCLALFNSVVEEQVNNFPNSRLASKIENGDINIGHYHAILSTLFHQTYSGPYTFARAGVNCSWNHEVAKEYLIRHAEEERTHWRWLLDDLKSTNCKELNLRQLPPHPTCQAYIGLNYYMAEEMPVARLAIAAVLEGIGAVHGATYGGKLLKALSLSKENATFFLSHAETDKFHIQELNDVISQCNLSSDEWMWMNHAAKTAGIFYRAMYDHEAFA